MYEARLYLMNNANSSTLEFFPLPWEPGLYGNLSSSVGGYNFESTGYRGVAYASCEHNGQSMFLNYTSNNEWNKTLSFSAYRRSRLWQHKIYVENSILKTHFNTSKHFIQEFIQTNTTEIALLSNNSTLEKAQLSYYHR